MFILSHGDSFGYGMGVMEYSSRVGIILLAIVILAPGLLIAMPGAANSILADSSRKAATAIQYDPSALFQPGVCFNDYSWAIEMDPDVRDFAIGDLNGDGLKDIATISGHTNSVCIFNQTVGGHFNPVPWRISNPGVVDMRSIVIGDLLGKDGKNDIAVSYNDSSGQGKICIFNQSDDFSSKILSLSGTEPFELTIGHFNGGTDNGIAVVCRGDPTASFDDLVEIWKYPFNSFASDHRFHVISSAPAFTNSRLIASGDINGDGVDDIVIGNSSGSNVYIMLQPSLWVGSWSTSTKSITGQASDIALVDVLGNGRNDLIFANTANVGGSSYVYVYRNNGTGFDNSPQTPTKTNLGLGSITVGEFSGEAGTDLLTLCKTNGNASAYFRNSLSSWYGSSPDLTFPVDENPLKAIVDTSIPSSKRVFVLSQGPTDKQSSITFFNVSSYLKGNADKNLFTNSKTIGEMATGTMSNGNVVVASVLPSSNEIMVYEPNTSNVRILTTESGPTSICMGSFDPDTNDDLAVLNAVTGSVSIYNGSSLFTSSYPVKNVALPFTGGQDISAKSVDGDGFDDLAIAHNTGVYILYCLDNWQYFSTSSSENLGVGIAGTRSALAWGDFTGDGISSDIAVLNSATDTVEIYLRKTSGEIGDYYDIMPSANLTDSGKTFLALAVGDFGVTNEQANDDRTDIVVLAQEGKALIYLQPNFGFEAFTFSVPSTRIEVGGETKTISAGDINDDGLVDMVIGHSPSPQISVYLRIGSLTFVNPFNFTTGAEASSVLANDLNGDRRADLLASSAGSHSLSIWYQANLAPSANATASKYMEDEGVDVTYSGAASIDSYSDLDSLNYTWMFDPGVMRYGKTVAFRYLTDGIKSTSLKVTDRSNLASWSNITMHILDKVPVASFTYSSANPIEGASVQFNDSSTSYPDAIVNWTWDFGDGEFSYLQNATHQFVLRGSYPIVLTVRDSDGSINSNSTTIQVQDVPPVASFTLAPENVSEGISVDFVDTSTGYDALVNWTWDFGDGTLIEGVASPTHIYAEGGEFLVNHTVWDADGKSNTTLRWIDVARVLPRVSFTVLGDRVEGRTLTLISLSQSYNNITFINWTFGDGSYLSGGLDLDQVSRVYDSQGWYNITLTVQEQDGDTNSSILMIFIQDTSPEIVSFRTEDGGSHYSEYDQVWFQVMAVPSYDALYSYNWDFEGTGVFLASNPLLANVSSYRYTQPGVYLARAMVQDSDGSQVYSQQLQIIISGKAPEAHFTWHNDTSVIGMVWFNAGSTIDTPNDISTLRFRWDFGDGSGTEYSFDPLVSHTFMSDGVYLVTLFVKDNDDIESVPQSVNIFVDRTVPEVVMEQDGMNATVGSPIHIVVRVTDTGSGVRSVILFYRIGEGINSSISMTPSQSSNLYSAIIEAQENVTRITYTIVVQDNANNEISTQEFAIQVKQPDNLAELMSVGIVLIALLLVLAYFIGRGSMIVDEVFIIYVDGRLMAHQTRRMKPGMDDEILSSMLVAIQSFVKDSFKDESSTHLQRLDFGKKKILVERGDNFYLAVVLHSNRAGSVPQRMQNIIGDIQKDFGEVLNEWDGDLEKVRGIKDQTDKLFRPPIPLALPGLKKEKAPEQNECPLCGFPVPSNAKKCPSCGSELSPSNINDLEAVDKNLDEVKNEEK
jgi:PKD repeat protein